MVKRSRRCPLKAKSWVRFPLEVPDSPFAVADGFLFYGVDLPNVLNPIGSEFFSLEKPETKNRLQ